MKIKFILIAVLLFLFSGSFAQNNSTGLTFTDYLRQMQADSLKNKEPAVQKPEAAPIAPKPEFAPIVPEPEVAPVAPESVVSAPQVPALPRISYEIFLDNIEAYANLILPEKEKLEFQKAAVKADSASPRDEFEKKVDYEKRLADFEKEREQKILALEKEYKARTKETMEKLSAALTSKEDIQPDWAGILKKDAYVEEYKIRIDRLTGRISEMKGRISQITTLLDKLEFGKRDKQHWQKKNQLFISRLEKACELMQDYILQEQAKILSTERYKFDMLLGAYNADNEEFEFNMNDSNSQTVPFNFIGTIKISPQQARETNRQTDDFTASVDYVNYPFMVNETKLYPKVKKTHVFYKEQELATKGRLKEISSLSSMIGYAEWSLYADSLLSGKLASKNLDSFYVRGASDIEIASGIDQSKESKGGFWTKKNIFRAAVFGLSAATFGLGLQQNSKVDSNNDVIRIKRLEAEEVDPNSGSYDEGKYTDRYNSAQKNYDIANNSASLRNGFYIGAGVFGLVGAVTFFF